MAATQRMELGTIGGVPGQLSDGVSGVLEGRHDRRRDGAESLDRDAPATRVDLRRRWRRWDGRSPDRQAAGHRYVWDGVVEREAGASEEAGTRLSNQLSRTGLRAACEGANECRGR